MHLQSWFFILILIQFQSCALLNKKGTWGKNALYPLRAGKFLEAVQVNASSPHVWGPLVGAGVIFASNTDARISNWVHHEGSVYKNVQAADNWSDNFNNIQKYEMYAMILFTPSYDEDKSFSGYLKNKLKGGFAVNIASSSSRFSVDQVRKVVHRKRPNNMDYKSLPSGHAAEAGSRRAIIGKGVEAIDMAPAQLKVGINVLNTAMSMGTVWARVEGKRHYPTDVLAGYAFGSFVSGVVYDTLMNLDSSQSFVFLPLGNRYAFQYTYLY